MSVQTARWLMLSRSTLVGDGDEAADPSQAVGRTFLDAEQLLTLEAGDADHEEFVEIGAGDRQEAQPLQQRMGAVAGLLQHAAVEREPAQLPVEIALAPVGRAMRREILGQGCAGDNLVHIRPGISLS